MTAILLRVGPGSSGSQGTRTVTRFPEYFPVLGSTAYTWRDRVGGSGTLN